MKYKIDFRPGARRSLKRLQGTMLHRVDAAVLSLADDPRPGGCKKMAGTGDTYRIRVGEYRIIYEIRDDVLLVMVIRIGHRREVYRGLN